MSESPSSEEAYDSKPEKLARATLAAIQLPRIDANLEMAEAILAAQLAIQVATLDELRSMRGQMYQCGHGFLGFCPYCVRDHS